ncbi:hypothetical protein LTS18_008318, partial [Coniosporium uncinatum]
MQKVLLVGATGETGKSIYDGLVEEGGYEINLLVRPSSAEKPAVKTLEAKGHKLVVADIDAGIDPLVPLLKGFNTIISAIHPGSQLAQLNLVDAARSAGVERFVPCGFASISLRGGIMRLHDQKEEVHDHIFRAHLPYTIIDVGTWYQISFPSLPSGRVDYASFVAGNFTIHADGKAPKILTDLRDIGRFVAKIVKDERTLNKRVYTAGDVLSEDEIFQMMEKASGEEIPRKQRSSCHDEKYRSQYNYSKYVRLDNTPEFAEYLGYLDARKLYSDFQPRTFGEYVEELLA